MDTQRCGRMYIGLWVMVGLTVGAAAQTASVEAPSVKNALRRVRSHAIRANMTFLADDLLEGRATGTRGYLIGAKYVAAQFEALGLEAAGGEGSYLQPIPFRKAEIEEQGSSMAIRCRQETVPRLMRLDAA